MCKHQINKINGLKQRLKAKNKKKSLKEYLKAKAPRFDFLPFLLVKSITIQ